MKYFVFFLGAIVMWIIFDVLQEDTKPYVAPEPRVYGYTVLDSDRVILSNGDTVLMDHKKNWQP